MAAGLFLLPLTSLSLVSCSATSDSEEGDLGYSNYMLEDDFYSGRKYFRSQGTFVMAIRPLQPRPSGGDGSTGAARIEGEIVVGQSIVPVVMTYTTDEHEHASGVPTQASLSVSLLDASDRDDRNLLLALFDTDDSNLPQLSGAALVFNFDFGAAVSSAIASIETTVIIPTVDGNNQSGGGSGTAATQTDKNFFVLPQ